MNDRDLETRLRATLHAEADQADPGALRERVHAIPVTVEPRLRRWWHGLGLGASRSAKPGGTRIKGGMSMSSALRVAAIAAALMLGTTFAISTVNVPTDAPPPGAETATGSDWVGVSGSGDWSVDLVHEVVSGPQVLSDPRVSGEMEGTWRTEYENVNDLGDWTIWGPMHVTNDEGSWEGEYIAFVESDGQRNIMGWMEGRGAYEGLSYIQHAHGPLRDISLTGLVYPGSIPPTVVLGMDGPLQPAPPLLED